MRKPKMKRARESGAYGMTRNQCRRGSSGKNARYKQEPHRSGVCVMADTCWQLTSGHCGLFSRSPLITHPASTQPQCMGQLIEPRRRFPDKLNLLRCNVGALSYCLPSNVPPGGIVDTALHHPAPLTCSVRKNRSNVRCLSNPPMCDQTVPHQYPLNASMQC